jgi:hypothetical protein
MTSRYAAQHALLRAADERDGEQIRTPEGYVPYWQEERAAICEYDGGMDRKAAQAHVAREVAARARGNGV